MKKDAPKILVSACLAGIPCNYKGQASPNARIIELVKNGEAIPVCPEILAGLSIPRPAVEIKNGRAVTKDGKDLTKEFMNGAQKVLEIAKKNHCQTAILKSKSPSCGKAKIHDGTFTDTLINDDGITAKLLLENNIEVINEEEI